MGCGFSARGFGSSARGCGGGALLVKGGTAPEQRVRQPMKGIEGKGKRGEEEDWKRKRSNAGSCWHSL